MQLFPSREIHRLRAVKLVTKSSTQTKSVLLYIQYFFPSSEAALSQY